MLTKLTDQLEDMSFADGEAYNAKLIPISRGDVLPDRGFSFRRVGTRLIQGLKAQNRKNSFFTISGKACVLMIET